MSKLKVKTINGVAKEELGGCLHTALRKCCDSDASSLVWSLVSNDATDKAWGEYLDLAWNQLLKSKKGEFHFALKLASEELDYGPDALKLSMGFLSERDWDGMAAYLEENL
jgi:hypothetical protein